MQKFELPRPSIAITKKRIFAILGEALFAVVAQDVRSHLSRCLHHTVHLQNDWMRALADASGEFISRLWNEVAISKFRLIAAKKALPYDYPACHWSSSPQKLSM